MLTGVNFIELMYGDQIVNLIDRSAIEATALGMLSSGKDGHRAKKDLSKIVSESRSVYHSQEAPVKGVYAIYAVLK